MSNEEKKIAQLENDPVRKLLSGLKRVEAPGDFDFRVKARIVSGRPMDRDNSWLPASVRLAVPLGLLLLVGGYFGLHAIYSPNNLGVSPVVGIQDTVPATDVKSTEPVAPPVREIIAKSVESKPADTDNDINARSSEKKIVLSGPSNRKPGGGSYDVARRISKTLRPKGVTAKDVLTFIGVEADALWKVGLVKQNSMADRSGLRTGDVIEAINDQTLTEKTVFGNRSSGKTVRVRRDNKSIQIDLKP